MDEKKKEFIIGIYENMTEEQKEKAKACKTMGEFMELAEKEGIELPDEMVDAVAGGYVYFDGWSAKQYEVIDDNTGDVLDYTGTADVSKAMEKARELGQCDSQVGWDFVSILREISKRR